MHISIFFIITFLIATTTTIKSQGFDWVYSWNSPFKVPKLFIGAYVGPGISSECISDDVFSKEISCCKFDDGTGNTIRAGIMAEYWIAGDYSLQATLGYGSESMDFAAERSDSILVLEKSGRFTPKNMKRIFDLAYTGQTVDFGLIGKTRIASTHFSIATGFSLSVPVSAFDSLSTTYTVEGLSFTPEQRFPNTLTDDFVSRSAVLFKPMVRCEYDFAVQKGIYLKTYLQTDYTLNSRVTNPGNWRSFTMLGGIAIMLGY
ncbi:MAG: hypothetical protein ACO30P_03295 [Candidatus Kapaibacteriota bacterium]